MIHPGVEIGDRICTRGTVCCFAECRDLPGVYLLSAAHVLADEGLAEVGWDIVSPSVYRKHPVEPQLVARLSRFVPFVFSERGYENEMDAALARIEEELLPLSLRPLEVSSDITTGMPIRLSTTKGLISGEVVAVDYDFAMLLKASQVEVSRAGFRSHVLCDVESLEGDSGAAVFDERGRLVGMHIAGNDDGAIFTPLGRIIEKLNISSIGLAQYQSVRRGPAWVERL